MNLALQVLAAVLRRLGNRFLRIASRLTRTPATLVQRGQDRNLYRTSCGDLLWLNDTGYLDRQIVTTGTFEAESLSAAQRLVRGGNVVLDVGANIGFYAIRFGKLVGNSGQVIAAEPTQHYRDILERNIAVNQLTNVRILDCGFSDQTDTAMIDIGPSSATMHSPAGFDRILFQEKIKLSRLDDMEESLGLQRLDFVKMDVDGHEPFVLRGAWRTFEKYSPFILMEISHLHYLQAGIYGWDFFAEVRDRGFRVYRERDFTEISSLEPFLRECCNFDRSANIILANRPFYSQ